MRTASFQCRRDSRTEDFAARRYDWHNFSGYFLRSYWREYDGSTNLRATVLREVTPGVSLIGTSDSRHGRPSTRSA